MGLTGPAITLGLDAKSIRPEDRERLRAHNGQESALIGTGTTSDVPVPEQSASVA